MYVLSFHFNMHRFKEGALILIAKFKSKAKEQQGNDIELAGLSQCKHEQRDVEQEDLV